MPNIHLRYLPTPTAPPESSSDPHDTPQGCVSATHHQQRATSRVVRPDRRSTRTVSPGFNPIPNPRQLQHLQFCAFTAGLHHLSQEHRSKRVTWGSLHRKCHSWKPGLRSLPKERYGKNGVISGQNTAKTSKRGKPGERCFLTSQASAGPAERFRDLIWVTLSAQKGPSPELFHYDRG